MELGATVSVRNQETGAEHTWKVVQSKSTGESGEIALDTPVARALLGHAVGETVPVAAAKPSRLTITAIMGPRKPAAPVVPSRSLPDAPIAEFSRGDDVAYEEWARRNAGAYVLIYGSSRGYMLHSASCSHIGLDSNFTLKTTPPTRPRLCSRSRAVLEHRSREETGERPVPCGTCFG